VRDIQRPTVTGLEFIPSAKGGIQAIVVAFSEAVDAATAGVPGHYQVVGDVAKNKQAAVDNVALDDDTHVRVTLAKTGIGANKRASLTVSDSITDRAGNKLDGDADGVQDAVDSFFDVFARGKEISFVDSTADKSSVSLKSAPPAGAIEAFFEQNGDLRLIRLVGTTEATQLLGKTAGTTPRPPITGTPFTDLLPDTFVPPGTLASAVDEVLATKPKKPGRNGRLGGR